MKISVLIPAHNEELSLKGTVSGILTAMDGAGIPAEVVVVDDHSADGTSAVLNAMAAADPRVRPVSNPYGRGYGYAVRRGLEVFEGDAVIIAMADASDDPADMVAYYRRMCEGYDCVFGDRFRRGARVTGYPWPKLILNRMGNGLIRLIFLLGYGDVTNAFKCYSRTAIAGIAPLESPHFNLTVEMPLKVIIRGYSWSVVPTNWRGRAKGVSKWDIKEMGSRYMSVIMSLWVERVFNRKARQ